MLQPAIPYLSNRNRVKFVFKSPTKRWSEVHWAPGIGAAAIPDTLIAAIRVARLRCSLLAADCQMLRVEVTCANEQRNTARDSSCTTFNRYGENTNESNNSYRVFIRAGTFNRASFQLGGIPDGVIEGDKWKNPLFGPWFDPMTSFVQSMIDTGWGIMGQLDGKTLGPRVRIVSINNALLTLNTITVTTKDPHACPAGANVVARIGLVKGTDRLHPANRIWQVVRTGEKTLNLLGFPKQTAEFALRSSGFLRRMARDFAAYSEYIDVGPSSRKRGVRTEEAPARRKLKRNIGY